MEEGPPPVPGPGPPPAAGVVGRVAGAPPSSPDPTSPRFRHAINRKARPARSAATDSPWSPTGGAKSVIACTATSGDIVPLGASFSRDIWPRARPGARSDDAISTARRASGSPGVHCPAPPEVPRRPRSDADPRVSRDGYSRMAGGHHVTGLSLRARARLGRVAR